MIDQLKKEYLNWVNRKIKIEQVDNELEITTPFVDMHHDYISIFLVKNDDKFMLTDDGYIVDELETLGVNLKSSRKRIDFFNTTLNIFGVKFNPTTSELYIEFNQLDQFPESQQRLTQCIIRTSDMMLTSVNRVANLFIDDIADFFLDNDIGYSDSVTFVGKTGRNQTFDFALPKTKTIRPKLIKAINKPSSDAYKNPLISFMDVHDSKSDHDFIVLANDIDDKISTDFTKALENYDIRVLTWSQRKDWITDLKTS